MKRGMGVMPPRERMMGTKGNSGSAVDPIVHLPNGRYEGIV